MLFRSGIKVSSRFCKLIFELSVLTEIEHKEIANIVGCSFGVIRYALEVERVSRNKSEEENRSLL